MEKKSNTRLGFKDHSEKAVEPTKVSNLKYTKPEMGNPEALKKSTDALAEYAKKNQYKGYK